MKIGDFVQWCDQINYPGLSGIVTKTRHQSVRDLLDDPPEIFVHWLIFPKEYEVGEGWEKRKDVELLSTGETE